MKKFIMSIFMLFAFFIMTFAAEITPTVTDYTLPVWITSVTAALLFVGQFFITNKWVALTKYFVIALNLLKKILVWITWGIEFLSKLIDKIPNAGEEKRLNCS